MFSSDAKGALLMTLYPLADCCHMLAIDAKTLHRWLSHASMPPQAHPSDARLKCLTLEQVWQLATLHARPMQPQFSVPLPQLQAERSLSAEQAHDAAAATPPHPLSVPLWSEVELISRLSHLETQVSSLQLLQERDLRLQRRLTVLETLVEQRRGQETRREEVQTRQEEAAQFVASQSHTRCLNPAEVRARSRLIPLIEYGAGGSYIIICSQEGELPLRPDSPQWFEWLASLSSFRFVGQQGRLTAYRERKHHDPTRSWRAYRSIHHRNYKHSLGVTDQLSINRLEQVAAILQAQVAAVS
jgi:hypothetical protein